MKKEKWFYKFQEEFVKRIEESGFTRVGYCHWQIESDDRYLECWDVSNNSTGIYEQIILTVHKATGFIFVYSSANKF